MFKVITPAILPDVADVIESHLSITLFELIKLSDVCQHTRKYIYDNFDKLFNKIVHTEETSILFNPKTKNIFLKSHLKLIFCFKKSRLTSTDATTMINFFAYDRYNRNLHFPIFKYLLWAKFYSQIELKPYVHKKDSLSMIKKKIILSPVKEKIIQKIINLWSTSSKKYCDKNISPITISNNDPDKQKIINTYFVISLHNFATHTSSLNDTYYIINLIIDGANPSAGFYSDGVCISLNYLKGLCKFTVEIIDCNPNLFKQIILILSEVFYTVKNTYLVRMYTEIFTDYKIYCHIDQKITKCIIPGPIEIVIINNVLNLI